MIKIDKSKYIKTTKKISNKIEHNIPLTIEEITYYYGIEAKLVKNICIMYKSFGREKVISVTLSDEEIDGIIKLCYPSDFQHNKGQ